MIHARQKARATEAALENFFLTLAVLETLFFSLKPEGACDGVALERLDHARARHC